MLRHKLRIFRFFLDMAPTKTHGALRGTIKGASARDVVSFTIRAMPIPAPLLEFIVNNMVIVKRLQQDHKTQQEGKDSEAQGQEEEENVADRYGDIALQPSVKPEQFWDAFRDKCKDIGGEWEGITDRVWVFGPQNEGGCLLIDGRKPGALAS